MFGSVVECGLQVGPKLVEIVVAQRPGEHLVNDGGEVMQRADGGQRSREGVVEDATGGTDEESVGDGEERDPTVEERPREFTIGPSDMTEHAGRDAVQA